MFLVLSCCVSLPHLFCLRRFTTCTTQKVDDDPVPSSPPPQPTAIWRVWRVFLFLFLPCNFFFFVLLRFGIAFSRQIKTRQIDWRNKGGKKEVRERPNFFLSSLYHSARKHFCVSCVFVCVLTMKGNLFQLLELRRRRQTAPNNWLSKQTGFGCVLSVCGSAAETQRENSNPSKQPRPTVIARRHISPPPPPPLPLVY